MSAQELETKETHTEPRNSGGERSQTGTTGEVLTGTTGGGHPGNGTSRETCPRDTGKTGDERSWTGTSNPALKD